jgi:hypothetical protein
MREVKQIIIKSVWLVSILFLGLNLSAQDTLSKSVLFIGNSFTYFYNLPQVVAAMAESQNIHIDVRGSTVGGANLKDHWLGRKETKTRELLENEKWDYVVLNNFSLGPIKEADRFREYNFKFIELIREKGAIPVLMQTWAYKEKPEMQKILTKSYREIANETKTDLVPCGELFELSNKMNPSLNLFFDHKHPSSNGTYLLGLAFYKYFTAMSTAQIPKNISMKDNNGDKLYLLFMSKENSVFLKDLVEKNYKIDKNMD